MAFRGGDLPPPPVPKQRPGTVPVKPPRRKSKQEAERVTEQDDDVYSVIIYGSSGAQLFKDASAGVDDEVYLDIHTNQKRNYCLQEILETEKNYISMLQVLEEHFMPKFHEHLDLFGSESCMIVFSNISEIREIHTNWMKELEQAGEKKDKQARLVSPIFREFSEQLKCYSTFCGLAPSGIALIDKLLKDKKKIGTILEQCRTTSGQRFGLKALIPVIAQRLQKYPLLLESLYGATPADHPDKVQLLSMTESMKELTKFIDDTKREKDDLREIEANLQGYKGRPLVLLGKVIIKCDCGLVATNGKNIDLALVILFDSGLLIAKYNWKEVSKAMKTKPLDLSVVHLTFCEFIVLAKIKEMVALTPSTIPDVRNAHLIDPEDNTSGWEFHIRGEDKRVQFVATKQTQTYFNETYCNHISSSVKKDEKKMLNGQSWNWPRKSVELGKELGKGNFGSVFKAKLSGAIDVAVKIFDQKIAANESQFLIEMETLALISRNPHPHLLQFYGLVPRDNDGPMWMITEYLELGDLVCYLRKFAHNRKAKPFQTLAGYATQVAAGMAHLEERKFVHRDLAARNVLLQSGDGVDNEICKIADFGLSRSLNGTGEYIMASDLQLPYKWMAPEGIDPTIDNKTFTIKSDVWSFGVLLVELFLFGDTPYKQLKTFPEYWGKLSNDYIVARPPGVPIPFYTMMQQCWNFDPNKRPSFANLHYRFELFWTVPNNVVDLQQTGYDETTCQSVFENKGSSISAAFLHLIGLVNQEFADVALGDDYILPIVLKDTSIPPMLAMPAKPPTRPSQRRTNKPTNAPPQRRLSYANGGERPKRPSGPPPVGPPTSKPPTGPPPSKPPTGHVVPTRRLLLEEKDKRILVPPPSKPPTGPPSSIRRMGPPPTTPPTSPPPIAITTPNVYTAKPPRSTYNTSPQGDYIDTVATPPPKFTWPREEWLRPQCNRDQAFQLLTQPAAQFGDFLVRPARDPIGAYSLSFRSTQIIQHFRILPTAAEAGGMTAYKMEGLGRLFPSLEAILEHYTVTSLLHDTCLQRPVPN